MGEAPRLPSRWTLDERLGRDRWVSRWSALDSEAERTVEAWVPRAATPYVNSTTGAFLDAYRALADTPASPWVVQVVAVLDEPAAVVIEPLSPHTLFDIRGRVPAPLVLQMAHQLLPVVGRHGEVLWGHLGLRDIAIRTDGQPCLAPRTLAGGSVENRIGDTAAPESFAGHPPSRAMALYGLGSVLFRLVTGRHPKPNGPSPIQYEPSVPAELDALIQTLRSRDPDTRLRALSQIPLGSESPAVDLSPFVLRPPTPQTALTARAQTSLKLDRALWGLENRSLRQLTPQQRSILSALVGLRVQHIQTLMEAGLPVVFDHHTSASQVREQIQLARSHGLSGGWLSQTFVGMGATGLALVLAMMAQAIGSISLVLTGALIGGLFLGITTLLTGGTSTLLLARAWSARSTRKGVLAAAERQLHWRQSRDLHPPLNRVVSTLCEIRFVGHDLPDAMQHDLRDVLMDVERRLDELEQLLQTTDDVSLLLVRPDVEAQLRGPTFDAHAPRSGAHLDDADRRRGQIYAWLEALHTALDRLGVALAHPRDEERLVADLGVSLAHVRSALVDYP